MLQIINKRGEILRLKADAVLTVESSNTLFNDGILKEDLTYPGNAPFCPDNTSFFKNAQRVDAKNEAYQLEVEVRIKDRHLFSGILNFIIKTDNYEYKVLPNFSGIADRSKKYTFAEINFADLTLFTPHANYSDIESQMKTFALAPDNYNVVFLPIKDEGRNPSYTNPIANPYDLPNNKFSIADNTTIQPFFKMLYLLKKVWDFLGLKAEGSVFSDPKLKAVFHYHNIRNRAADITFAIRTNGTLNFQSGFYLPKDMLISDFLKYLRDRHHLAYNVDYDKKTVNITSFLSIYKSDKTVDLSPYFQNMVSFETPEVKSLKVSLIDPSSDDLFIANPEKAIIIGQGNNPTDIAINVATTKQTKDGTNTILYTKTIGNDYIYNPELVEILYTGFNANNYPSATANPLTADDASFYNFLNEAKIIKAVFKLPLSVLLALKADDKCFFITDEGIRVTAIIDTLNYDASDNLYIDVEIKMRYSPTLNNRFKIETNSVNQSIANLEAIGIRANFKAANYPTGISFSVYFNPTGPFGAGTYTKIDTLTIKKPCDKYGIGGDTAILNKHPELTNGNNFDNYRFGFDTVTVIDVLLPDGTIVTPYTTPYQFVYPRYNPILRF